MSTAGEFRGPYDLDFGAVLVYAVVSAETGKAVELFVRRESAERMLAEALADEPDWRDVLSVEEIKLTAGPPSLS